MRHSRTTARRHSRRRDEPFESGHFGAGGHDIGTRRVGSPTGQSARPCRSARPRRCRDADRRRPSGFETAVELRLGEKCARQFENLVGPAQLLGLALQGLDAFTLGRTHAIALSTVELVALDPIQQRLRACSQSSAQSIRLPPTSTGARYTARVPGVLRAPGLSGKNLLGFLFMAPFSQELEPPQNSGRFTHSRKGDHGVFPDAYHRLGIYKIERWLNFEKNARLERELWTKVF